MKNYKIIFKKIPAGFLLFLLLVIFTEWMLGCYLRPALENKNKNKNENCFRIICLGDSFTYDFPDSEAGSWPEFLEEFLNKKSKTKKFRIYNLAYEGIGIDVMLHRLQKEYKYIDPDMVILMGGNCFVDFLWFWPKELEESNIKRKIFIEENLNRLVLNLSEKIHKIIFKFKMASLIFNKKTEKKESIRQSEQMIYELIKQGNECRDQRKSGKAENYYRQALSIDPLNIYAIIEISRYYTMKGNFELALNMLEQGLETDPEDEEIYNELDALFIKENLPQRRILFFEKLSRAYPNNKKVKERLFRSLKVVADELKITEDELFSAGEFEKSFFYYLKRLRLEKNGKKDFFPLEYNMVKKWAEENNPDINASTKLIRKFTDIFIEFKGSDKAREQKTINDLKKILRICKKINAPLVLCSYPRKVPLEISEFSSQQKVALIDLRPDFKKKLETESICDYFLGDSKHCSEKGNRLAAEIIGCRILDFLDIAGNKTE